jgi:hypothetical protein
VHPHIGGGAVLVVGQHLDDDADPAGAEALIADLGVIGAVALLALLDRAVDDVLRHRLGLSVVDRQAQARIHRRVGQAGLGRDGDFARQLGEERGARRVRLPLAVHDVLEF